jgi:hypothetical protein
MPTGKCLGFFQSPNVTTGSWIHKLNNIDFHISAALVGLMFLGVAVWEVQLIWEIKKPASAMLISLF